MTPDDELLAVFKAEVGQQIGELSELLARAPARWAVDQAMHLAHNVKGAARTVDVAAMVEVAHALEDLFGALGAGPAPGPEGVRLAREGARLLEDCFDALDDGSALDTTGYRAKVTSFLRGRAGDAVEAAPPDGPAPASREEGPLSGDPSASSETIRIGIERLDALTELSAELSGNVQRAEEQRETITRLRAALLSAARAHPELRAGAAFRDAQSAADDLHRRIAETAADGVALAGRLREALRLLRMVRIDTLRRLLGKTLRDACADAGRDAELRVEGEQVEIDRAVLDHLRAPLVHLIRNAVAHGIEPLPEREARGKPPDGLVRIRARSLGEWAEITVSDDGRGLHPTALARRAVSLGLMTPAEVERASEADLLDLVFRPGFSTSASVSELSGRGVGLDIVKSAVAALGGSVTMSSTPFEGAQFHLRVPLTRLTLSAILVRVADQAYAVPTAAVERTLFLAPSDVHALESEDVASVGGALVPVADLAAALGLPASTGDERAAIVLADGARRRALRVDEVIGQTELTVQPLPWNVGRVPFVSSASVLGSGELVLVLDTHELLAASGGTALRPAAVPEVRRRPRILVADDSITSRTLEKNILTAAGFEVIVAADGQQAFELARTSEVDLLISDVHMPRLSGLELTNRVRATKEIERLPIILITSLGSEDDKQRGADAGADAYIVKGAFDQETLLRTVGRLL